MNKTNDMFTTNPTEQAKKQRGFSLIEIIAVIGIIAFLVITAVNYVQDSQGQTRVSSATEQTKQIVSAVNDWSPRSGLYTGVDINRLISDGYLAVPRDDTGTEVAATEMNPWGGAIALASPTTTTFSVTFSGITRAEEAQQLVQRLEQMGNVTANTATSATVVIGG